MTAAASVPRRGLDERSDTRLSLDAPPVVYHPLYSAPQLPPGHRFPMVGVAPILQHAPCIQPSLQLAPAVGMLQV